jgi:hypothetical protein
MFAMCSLASSSLMWWLVIMTVSSVGEATMRWGDQQALTGDHRSITGRDVGPVTVRSCEPTCSSGSWDRLRCVLTAVSLWL